MQKILIFGIGGFAGKYLAQEFLNNGYDVIGSDIVQPKNLQHNVSFYKCNLLEYDNVSKLINNLLPDMIVNLAAISSVATSWNIPQMTMSVNVIGALNILEAAKLSKKMPKIMFVGSSEEYSASEFPLNEEYKLNSSNPYGISKVTQEIFAKLYRDQYGMKIYCVRPFNHTGVGQSDSFVLPSFCKQVAAIEKSKMSGVIKVGNLTAKRDFSDVRDIVRAYRMVIESNDCTKIYNVGSGKAYSLQSLLDYIISLSSQKISVEIDSERLRPIDNMYICCDNTSIRSDLGWDPQYCIYNAISDIYNYYLSL